MARKAHDLGLRPENLCILPEMKMWQGHPLPRLQEGSFLPLQLQGLRVPGLEAASVQPPPGLPVVSLLSEPPPLSLIKTRVIGFRACPHPG